MGYVYFGEAAGGRIIRYGVGFSQVGAAYQLQVQTWPHFPAGESGLASFRRLEVLLRHTLGYAIKVTPIVDGIPRAPTSFSGGPPSSGQTEELKLCPAGVWKAGARIEARVETTALSGETEIVDVGVTEVVVREQT